jgi:small-conductance mechanosensitive channel
VPTTVVPIAILVVIAVAASLSLRRFSTSIRTTFDGLCFVAISFYFWRHGILPVFPPLSGQADVGAISLRAIGGAWWLLAARLIVTILWFGLHRDRRSREARLFSDLSAAAIYIATAMVVLNSVFALPVTGVVATSGVVAIVLGLALQNTLADVFAGIAVGIESPFSVGDRIQVGDKIEGQVVQVNWRSIRIHTDGDDVAIIPNSVVAKAEIVNRSFPSQHRAASVEISCPESVLPESVIETLLQATLLCPDILRTPTPRAIISHFGRRRNRYRISFRVENTSQLSSTMDMLLRAARRQLHYAGFLDQDRRNETTALELEGGAVAPRRLLRDVVLFESLNDEQVNGLAGQLISRRFEPGETVFVQNDVDTSLYLVASGIVEFTRQVDGAWETLGCIGAGEYVGEIGLLTGAAHAATATARSYCLIYQLPHAALATLMEQSEELMKAFEKSARKGLEVLHRDVAARATPDIGGPGQLLMRIKSFFRFRSG